MEQPKRCPKNYDNECTLGTDNCDAHAACTNSIGSYTCVCNAGYIGDGEICIDDDECTVSTDNCDANADCINSDGSFTCAYDNECTLGIDNCDANAACTNTVGSSTCECNTGYNGDGVTCTDIDECNLSTDNCDANSTCNNTVGSFTCACDAGYNGDGVTCTVCMDYLGMENGTIPDGNIQASSEYDSSNYDATKGRLNGPSSWYPVTDQQDTIWIQADIGYLTYVTAVITQGSGDSYKSWVTSFKVSTFETTSAIEGFVEDENGDAIIFPGNVDYSTEVTTTFSEPVYARIVRINCLSKSGSKSATYWALRFEILGCKKD
ncbi:uncharacterized protein [Amphiura filiformis]|uniref:uncharacterized protein n=1 Tax=Amphiura filiformis TaxID=82378 RepID=UPI003B2246D0